MPNPGALPTCLPREGLVQTTFGISASNFPSTLTPLRIPPFWVCEPHKLGLEEHSWSGSCCVNSSSNNSLQKCDTFSLSDKQLFPHLWWTKGRR